jgi:hypothetical protein
VGEGQEDEAVFPIRTGAKALAAAFLDEIGTMVMPKPSYAFAGAGGAGAGRPVENHWHIGTLIADDRGIKELERRQSQFRISEAQRKGANS